MDIFLSIIVCHRFSQHHFSLLQNASKHTLYSLVDTEETSSLLRKTNDILQRNVYVPSPYCSFDVHGQLQTTVQFILRNIGAFCLIQSNQVNYKREVINTTDGAVIALDWAYMNENEQDTDPYLQTKDEYVPTVILHHGLCGDSYSEHIVYLARKFLTCKVRRFRVVVVVMRGCGGMDLATSDTMNGSRTGDLRDAIKYIHFKLPKSRLFGMGFSLGAGVMLKYLGEEGGATSLEAAVAISPPWDGQKESPYYPLWSYFLAIPVKLYALKHRNILSKKLSLFRILTSGNLRQVDALLAQSYGFQDVNEYYLACSPLPHVHNVKVPTLAISARDDPVCFHGSAPPPIPAPISLALPLSLPLSAPSLPLSDLSQALPQLPSLSPSLPLSVSVSASLSVSVDVFLPLPLLPSPTNPMNYSERQTDRYRSIPYGKEMSCCSFDIDIPHTNHTNRNNMWISADSSSGRGSDDNRNMNNNSNINSSNYSNDSNDNSSNSNNTSGNNSSSSGSNISSQSHCGLIILKTLLGGHLAFPFLFSSPSSSSFSSSSSLSYFFSPLLPLESWSDCVAYEWVLSFLDTDSGHHSHHTHHTAHGQQT